MFLMPLRRLPPPSQTPLIKNKIIIYGDSHAGINFNNLIIPGYSIYNFFQSNITMYRIGRDNKIINFDTKHLGLNNTFILSYGEIDVRYHIQNQIDLGRNENDIIDQLVTSYFTTIQNNITSYNKIIILAVLPPKEIDATIDPNKYIDTFPFLGSIEKRVQYQQNINNVLQNKCSEFGYIFFNPFSPYTNDKGCLLFALSDHDVHVGDNQLILKSFVETVLPLL